MKTTFRCEEPGCKYYLQLRDVEWPVVGEGLVRYDPNPVCTGCGRIPSIESSDWSAIHSK